VWLARTAILANAATGWNVQQVMDAPAVTVGHLVAQQMARDGHKGIERPHDRAGVLRWLAEHSNGNASPQVPDQR
jgi:hypothetical protein